MANPIIISPRLVSQCWTALAVFLILLTRPVFASCQTEGLKFDHAQLRATPPDASVSAGYLQITNTTGQTQRLVSASAPFAKRAEIHYMKHDSGVMKMFEIKSGLAVPDRLTVALIPKGSHLMFMGLDRQLKEDDIFLVTLEFAPCGQVTLPFHVTRLPRLGQIHGKTHKKGDIQKGHDHKQHDHSH
tara:strand:+ start:988 stop:1548 length:561 start_codon:yes stop_codon:yes gene_type:complete